MIKVVLLSAILLLGSSATRMQHRILENVMTELNMSIPEDLQRKMVPDYFSEDKCCREEFCKAEAALKKIEHGFMKKWNIIRTLKVLHNVTDCPIIATGDELQVKHLVKKMRHCAQRLYAKP